MSVNSSPHPEPPHLPPLHGAAAPPVVSCCQNKLSELNDMFLLEANRGGYDPIQNQLIVEAGMLIANTLNGRWKN